jgi:hypothetical protein
MFKQIISREISSLKAISIIAILAVLTAGLAVASNSGFNIMSGDQELLRLKNQTQGTVNWQDPISANAGDTIRFEVYYHCGTDDAAWSTIKALGTKVRIEFPTTQQTTIATIGRVSASNLATVSDTGTINASSAQKLIFNTAAVWYHDGTSTNVTAVLGSGYAEVNLGTIDCDYTNCYVKAGFVIFTATISSIFPAPTIDLKVNGSDGPITINYNNAALLTWTTTNNPTTCTAGIDWSGAKSIPSGSESTGLLTATKTYNLTCSNTVGSASDSVLVQVLYCLPAPPPFPF